MDPVTILMKLHYHEVSITGYSIWCVFVCFLSGFLFLLVHGRYCIIWLWQSLSLPCSYLGTMLLIIDKLTASFSWPSKICRYVVVAGQNLLPHILMEHSETCFKQHRHMTGMRKFRIAQDFLIEHWHRIYVMSVVFAEIYFWMKFKLNFRHKISINWLFSIDILLF